MGGAGRQQNHISGHQLQRLVLTDAQPRGPGRDRVERGARPGSPGGLAEVARPNLPADMLDAGALASNEGRSR